MFSVRAYSSVYSFRSCGGEGDTSSAERVEKLGKRSLTSERVGGGDEETLQSPTVMMNQIVKICPGLLLQSLLHFLAAALAAAYCWKREKEREIEMRREKGKIVFHVTIRDNHTHTHIYRRANSPCTQLELNQIGESARGYKSYIKPHKFARSFARSLVYSPAPSKVREVTLTYFSARKITSFARGRLTRLKSTIVDSGNSIKRKLYRVEWFYPPRPNISFY